jgi:hypothetical protein
MTNNSGTNNQPKFAPGDIVNVRGYGGAAKVIKAVDDGITPHGHTKWLYTVEFGPFSDGPASPIGYALKNTPMGKWYGTGRTLKRNQGKYHEFYQGRLSPFREPATAARGNTTNGSSQGRNGNNKPVSEYTKDEIIAALKALNIEYQEA